MFSLHSLECDSLVLTRGNEGLGADGGRRVRKKIIDFFSYEISLAWSQVIPDTPPFPRDGVPDSRVEVRVRGRTFPALPAWRTKPLHVQLLRAKRG